MSATEADSTSPLTPRDAGHAHKESAWTWIGQAIGVYRRQAPVSLGYGLAFTLIGYALALYLWAAGLVAAMPMAIGAFALVGPLMAGGLYAVARADEEGRQATVREALLPQSASPLQIGYLGVIILVAVLVWILVAIALFAIFHAAGLSSVQDFGRFALTTPRGLTMVMVGSLLGGAIAFGIFSISAFSIPMLMDKETDFVTAIIHSVETVKARPMGMLVWAWLIALFTAIGAVTLLVGFVFLFPILGYATWIGYRDVFGPSA